MPTLTVTDDQVIELIKQLPPERKHAILFALAKNTAAERGVRMAYAEEQLRRLCTERGLNWDSMSEEERETFIDDLVHEDRSCLR
jgi:hypothetical protein